jgi:HPt (histidine-containing phosphotransfer) domain-containing protein
MNIKALADNLGLDEEEYLELIDLFLETGMTDLDTLESAIREADADLLARTAHSLKGASANLGLTDFSEVAKGIELQARDTRVQGAAAMVQQLRSKMDDIVALKGP